MSALSNNFRRSFIGGVACISLAACTSSYQADNTYQSTEYDYGYSHSYYGYDTADVAATTHRSRYGNLRGACVDVVQTCGLMAVVPVYPVYQVISAPLAPEVPITVEAPPQMVPEITPEPPIYIAPPAPEPVYTPAPQHWPEPDTPAQTWTPIRK